MADRPEEVTTEHLVYLDNLRETGATNMFGAGEWVESAFGVGRREARKIVRYWMDTFGEDDR